MNSAEGQPGFVGEFGRAVNTHRRPAEPRADCVRRLEPHPTGADTGHHGFELDDAMPTTLEQLGRPSEDAKRVTTQPDIAVGEQHRLPAAGTGQGFENVPTKYRRPAAARHPDGRRRLIDSQRRNTPSNELSHQTSRTATQVDCRTLAQRQHGEIEVAVGMPAAKPFPHREVSNFTVVVADPTPLTAQSPVVEIPQHLQPRSLGRVNETTIRCALGSDDIHVVDGVDVRQLGHQSYR